MTKGAKLPLNKLLKSTRSLVSITVTWKDFLTLTNLTTCCQSQGIIIILAEDFFFSFKLKNSRHLPPRRCVLLLEICNLLHWDFGSFQEEKKNIIISEFLFCEGQLSDHMVNSLTFSRYFQDNFNPARNWFHPTSYIRLLAKSSHESPSCSSKASDYRSFESSEVLALINTFVNLS